MLPVELEFAGVKFLVVLCRLEAMVILPSIGEERTKLLGGKSTILSLIREELGKEIRGVKFYEAVRDF